MEVPELLKHKPIIAVNGYDENDAQFAGGTDARALSIGIAQYDDYNDDHNKEISLKVWRHTGEKWSRQSEELPIHRCIDLNILFLDSLLCCIENKYPDSFFEGTIINADKIKDIARYYDNKKEYLKPRLIELKNKLNKLTDFIEND
ncbi:MAG: hypothetical protein EOL95_10800 [Bacteroidia bacterium]|nr:hypothetical protein [Bacteroidia bacterium]